MNFGDLIKIHCLPCLPVYRPKNVFSFLRKNPLSTLSTRLPPKKCVQFSEKNPLSTLSTRLPPKKSVQFSEKKKYLEELFGGIVYLSTRLPTKFYRQIVNFWDLIKIHCLTCLPIYRPKNVFSFLREKPLSTTQKMSSVFWEKKSIWRNFLEALSTCLSVYQ